MWQLLTMLGEERKLSSLCPSYLLQECLAECQSQAESGCDLDVNVEASCCACIVSCSSDVGDCSMSESDSGSDMGTVPAAGRDACCRACAFHAKCYSWTFSTDADCGLPNSAGCCHLKVSAKGWEIWGEFCRAPLRCVCQP